MSSSICRFNSRHSSVSCPFCRWKRQYLDWSVSSRRLLIELGVLSNPFSLIWRNIFVRDVPEAGSRDLDSSGSGQSNLRLGAIDYCPRGGSGLTLLYSSHLPTIQASAAMYWLARWSISGTTAGGRSTRDQKNLEGRRPIVNACINREG